MRRGRGRAPCASAPPNAAYPARCDLASPRKIPRAGRPLSPVGREQRTRPRELATRAPNSETRPRASGARGRDPALRRPERPGAASAQAAREPMSLPTERAIRDPASIHARRSVCAQRSGQGARLRHAHEGGALSQGPAPGPRARERASERSAGDGAGRRAWREASAATHRPRSREGRARRGGGERGRAPCARSPGSRKSCSAESAGGGREVGVMGAPAGVGRRAESRGPRPSRVGDTQTAARRGRSQAVACVEREANGRHRGGATASGAARRLNPRASRLSELEPPAGLPLPPPVPRRAPARPRARALGGGWQNVRVRTGDRLAARSTVRERDPASRVGLSSRRMGCFPSAAP